MTKYDVMRQAFADELSKIAGEMQGFTRLGRKPIGIDRLLEREAESELTPTEVFMSEEESEKTSALRPPKKYEVGAMGAAGLMGVGALGYHHATKAKQDWETGRMMRLQNGG